MVVRNLLLADWFDEEHSESLLNTKRSRWARELVANVRQACCVSGQCDITVCLPSSSPRCRFDVRNILCWILLTTM